MSTDKYPSIFSRQMEAIVYLTTSTLVNTCKIGHVRYINILTWLRGFQVKLLYLVSFFFVSKSLLGIERQKKQEICKFDPKASDPC